MKSRKRKLLHQRKGKEKEEICSTIFVLFYLLFVCYTNDKEFFIRNKIFKMERTYV